MIKLFWSLPFIAVAYLVHICIATIPGLILRIIGLGKLGDKWIFFNSGILGKLTFFLIGARVEITGETKALNELRKSKQNICYISNHQGILDIPLVLGPIALETGFIAKKEVALIPFVNIMAVAYHSVFMDRKNLKKSVASIHKGVKKVQKGHPLLIFPEGTRSKTGHVQTFKHGSFKLATESRAVIVPLVIKGTRDLCENRKKLFSTIPVRLHVCAPIKTECLDRNQIFEMAEKIEKDVKEIYEQL